MCLTCAAYHRAPVQNIEYEQNGYWFSFRRTNPGELLDRSTGGQLLWGTPVGRSCVASHPRQVHQINICNHLPQPLYLLDLFSSQSSLQMAWIIVM